MFSSRHTNSHCRVARRHGAPLPATGAASLNPRTSTRRGPHQQASSLARRASLLAPASLARRTNACRPRTLLPGPRRSACARQRARANPYGAPENRLDPRPSAPPPARAAMPKHLPRFSSGHTDSRCRMARRHGASLPPTGAASLDPGANECRPRTSTRRGPHQQVSSLAPRASLLAPASADLRTNSPRASHRRLRLALRKTALIRAPQLRRRRGRLCHDTCHGFPPVIRTRTAVWRSVNQLPATGYQLPATGYQLPATSYRLPATG